MQTTSADPVRELFLAWRAPDPIARWYTVGRLLRVEAGYCFEYTAGFEQAHDEAGMRPIPGFPDPTARYVDRELFPLFKNRLMRPSRPDYAMFIEQLGFTQPPEPLDFLARSQGYRATDYFRVYPRPLPVETPEGQRFRVVCFAAGLRFQTAADQAEASRLVPGDALCVVPESDNVNDPHAHRLDTVDGHHVGYVPRYHAADLTLLRARGARITARVLQNNSERAPSHRQLLCVLDAPWPPSFVCLATTQHQPLAEVAEDWAAVAGV